VGATVGARKNSGAFNANIYKAEIRVRSFNAGSRKPSAWSEALLLETEKEEQKRMSLAKNKHNKSMKEMTNEEAVAESKRKQSDTGESVDTRLHVVVQLDLDTLLNVRHTLADKQDTTKMMEDAAWSDFRQTLGLFFVEAGALPFSADSHFSCASIPITYSTLLVVHIARCVCTCHVVSWRFAAHRRARWRQRHSV
jgi:hypothetical protein